MSEPAPGRSDADPRRLERLSGERGLTREYFFSRARAGTMLVVFGSMKTSRQSFVLGVMGACATGILTAACGGDDDPGVAKTNTSTGGKGSSAGGACTVEISNNHKHAMAVSSADVTAGTAKEYDITGTAPHTHKVSLAASDFKALADGDSVIVTSSTDAGHSHDVEITC
jgi:hypothetical protein